MEGSTDRGKEKGNSVSDKSTLSEIHKSTLSEINKSTLSEINKSTFNELGVCKELCIACESLGWHHPTAVQRLAIPKALQGHDIIGLAETGSGKTAAFAIPILQDLLECKQRFFAVILSPTRELSNQIATHFKAVGSVISPIIALLIGGVDMVKQTQELAARPHIIVASPGRLVDHLENTKGFSLKTIKYLVMDEADKLLSHDFEAAVHKIVELAPKQRRTYLFSATMTAQVQKLKRASLIKPFKVSVSTKYDTSSTLIQHFKLVPLKYKATFLYALISHFSNYYCMIFTNTCLYARQLTAFLFHLNFEAVSLHGQLSQPQRESALSSFRAGKQKILVATDVGSRGLDIPGVDIVVNCDVPSSSKDYIHRVGRTARAGRSGRAITIVTQYDVVAFTTIESKLGSGTKLPEFNDIDESKWKSLNSVAAEAQRTSEDQIREVDLEEKAKRSVLPPKKKRRKILGRHSVQI